MFWGGPDYPARCLRDLLEERIHAVPPGGEILWVTYYFRDESLARALIQARSRGVKVRVVVEENPRTDEVNSRVRQILAGDKGLGNGARFLKHNISKRWPLSKLSKCRLHEKLYYFSHPAPNVLVGTFNPSGNSPEDPEIINQIGDQDRGHNVLVEIRDPVLVKGLHAHAQNLCMAYHGPWEYLLPRNNRVLISGKTRIIFFPRVLWKDFNGLFDDLTSGCRVRIAVSHLNDSRICKLLIVLAKRGVRIEIIAHDTLRRVPSWVEKQMLNHGIIFYRYIHPEGLPMHNKFMLFESTKHRIVTFGSMNLSVRSLHANHELLVITKDNILYREIEKRWQTMLFEIMTSG